MRDIIQEIKDDIVAKNKVLQIPKDSQAVVLAANFPYYKAVVLTRGSDKELGDVFYEFQNALVSLKKISKRGKESYVWASSMYEKMLHILVELARMGDRYAKKENNPQI